MVPADPQAKVPDTTPHAVNLPAPTAWPIVLAFGITLLSAGLVTSPSIGFLGAVLAWVGCIGWFRDVFPHEKEEAIKVEVETAVISTVRREVERLPVAPELPRALLPLETYPVSAGIKGGLAGAVAMAVLACLYGILVKGSIWYPINLLAATAYGQSQQFATASLSAFHLDSFLLAVVIHLITALLVGLLYGAMLPMLPSRPILLGGLIAPILWTGLLRSILGLLNPLLNQLIDWRWFIASQFAFGIVAGLVVVRQTRMRTRQFAPFLMRAGIDAPGMMEEKAGEGRIAMSSRPLILGALGLSAFVLCACANAPGRPLPGNLPVIPSEVSDFNVLFSQNCAGCHGSDGKGGAAIALADPVYLEIADDDVLRRATANGISGTSMPAFAQSAGGILTDKQVDAIVRGIRERWAKPDVLRGANPPPYSTAEPGDASHGSEVYSAYCSSCHGDGGRGGKKASSIVEDSFLALVTDQELRTIVIAGRPELGAPDWRDNIQGKPMSARDVSDVVAWLGSQRTKFPGQPYPSAFKSTGESR